MIEGVPGYVSSVFILTTFLTIGFLFYAIKQRTLDTFPAKVVIAAIAFWLVFTGVLAVSGFYLETSGIPPRFAFIPLPTLLFIGILFAFYREGFIDKLPLRILTLLHIVRIPVEIVLWWLFKSGQIPEIMTFEGSNFDILAGITAPLIAILAFRGRPNRTVLIVWNLVCLALVTTIVTIAVFSLPTSFQQFGLDQPNRAVLQFPYVWLPAIVVPIVLFAHFVSLFQLFRSTKQKT